VEGKGFGTASCKLAQSEHRGQNDLLVWRLGVTSDLCALSGSGRGHQIDRGPLPILVDLIHCHLLPSCIGIDTHKIPGQGRIDQLPNPLA